MQYSRALWAATAALSFSLIAQGATLYGISQDKLIRIDPVTGAGTLVGTGSYGNFPFGLAAFNGQLYTLNQSTDEILELNPSTGGILQAIAIGLDVAGEGGTAFDPAGTLLFSRSSGGTGILYKTSLNGSSTVVGDLIPSMDGLDFAPNGTMYGLSQTDGQSINLYTINPATAGTTLVGPTRLPLVSVLGLAIRQSDGAFFAAAGDSLYSVDPVTGLSTLIGATGFDSISGLTFLESKGGGGGEIPEPSTWAMIAGGLALAVISRRR